MENYVENVMKPFFVEVRNESVKELGLGKAEVNDVYAFKVVEVKKGGDDEVKVRLNFIKLPYQYDPNTAED